ncbi:conjugal transfer protein TraB [Thiocapsa imhoffii]|uniref:Conjugal transfer protein TraB n=1 Tax=Thiocapsa imhoffii TaxID=382777 RepID=A0A9X0WJN5_9GAMM|nr:TraB/GumN family protein [Thiocapsa imhoffii]MBK1645564.1 conjugal transfer protein TraB [Thiocapsa imhoffii]
MSESNEPKREIDLADVRVTLLGTAHVSRASAEEVRTLLRSGDYDAVAVELCQSRFSALMDPKSLSELDLFSVIRQRQVYMVMANLALSAYQQRLADQFDIEPGAEQRVAVHVAKELDLPVLLIDREIGVTLKRISANLNWWKRYTLFTGLLASMLTAEKVSEEEIEHLKDGDVLETTFAEFAHDRQDLYRPLIDERDRYMAAKLRSEPQRVGAKRILAVVGAGHLKGIGEYLERDREEPRGVVRALEQVPPPSRWPRVLAWLVVILILSGFAFGFSQSTSFGWGLVVAWVLINGGLSALGVALAGGHPLTVGAAFVAAPLTSLNPTIGAGMVTAAVELAMRKPRVADFGHLRADVVNLRGWWRNRVSRVFLVFLFSTLGSAIGTYVAGFHIFDQLVRGPGA